MSVDASAITQTATCAASLLDVTAGTTCVEHGNAGTVTRVAARRSQAVRIVTEGGYELTCTATQMMRSPTGWAAARDARHVTMTGYHARASTVVPRDRPHECLLLCDDALVRVVRTHRVGEERPAQLDLVVHVGRAQARHVQWALLALGVRAARAGDRLVITQPYASTYARLVGCVRDSVTEHCLQGGTLAPPVIDARTQAEISAQLALQGLEGLKTHGALVREIQELASLVLNAELRVVEALRMASLLRALPVQNAFLRNRLVTLLERVCAIAFTERVVRVEPTHRIDMIGLVGADYVANGFVCRREQ